MTFLIFGEIQESKGMTKSEKFPVTIIFVSFVFRKKN